MLPSDQLRQITELLEPAKSVTVVVPADPTLDTIAAGLALYLALSATGKQVSVFCPSDMTVEFSHLVGVDKITNTIGADQGKNLVISFPYQEGSIEKVSYKIEEETFNLVIEPREGYPMITSDAIRFSYGGGGQPDLLITIGISKMADLQDTLGPNMSVAESKPVIAIAMDPQHERVGKVDVVVPAVAAISEIIADMITALSLRLDGDVSTNLLAGVIDASDNFSSPNTTAQTFETAALLSRSGARKTPMAPRQLSQQPQAARIPSFPSATPPMQQQQRPQRPFQQQQQPQPAPQQQYQQQPATRVPNFPAPQPQVQQQQQQRQPRPFQQQQQRQPRPFQQQQPVSQPPAQQPQQQQQPQNETPADWLKPKIYKGSSMA